MVVAAPPAPPAVHLALAPVTTRAAIPASIPASGTWTSYLVRPGDTLIELAATFGTTPGELAARNGIGDPRTLQVGARIQVPGRAGATAGRAAPTGVARSYVVRAGDTLFGIAARHGMTLPALVKANGLDVHAFIHPGQVLRVGAVGGAAKASAARTRQQATASRSAGRAASPRTLFPQHTTTPQPTNSVSRNRAILATAVVPDRLTTKSMITATAHAHGVDTRLALAIAMQESGWNQRNVSGANAIGVMQVIPTSGTWAETLLGRQLNLFDTQDNITAGMAILRALTRMASSGDEAIAAYYQGLGSVRERGWYTDTKAYVASVKALRARM